MAGQPLYWRRHGLRGVSHTANVSAKSSSGMLLRVPALDVPDEMLAEGNRAVLVAIRAEERAEQVAPLRRRVQAIGVVEDVPGLVPHVHHDLAIGLERIRRLFDRLQLRIGQVERDAEHRLLIRASPLVGQVADRAKLLQTAPIELLV